MDKINPYLQADLLFPYVPDIGNALAGVLSATQALRYGAARDREFRRALLDDMEDNLQHLRIMYENLIVSEALRSGTLELSRQWVERSTWLSSFLAAWAKRATDKGVAWDVVVPMDLSAAWLDRLRVELALENLVWGALASTPGGTAVRVAVGDSEAVAWFEVSDLGSELTQTALAAALKGEDPAAGDGSRFAAGRLLGIRVAAALAELHGGALQVVAREGFNTTMRLSLAQG